MVKKRVRRPRFNSSRRSSDLLMTFNRVMLIVVIALVVVAAVTYGIYVIGNDRVTSENVRLSSGVQNVQNVTCTDQCSNVTRQCSGNGYRMCGNYDNDACLEWSNITLCSSGQVCSNGNCISSCTDTDGGLNYYVRGTAEIINGNVSYTDFCYRPVASRELSSNSTGNRTLIEYYCSNSSITSRTYICPIECSQGRCIGNSSGGGTCFLPETLITTSNGNKMIKDIKEGDVVMSYNEKTDKYEYGKVTKTFEHIADGYLVINNKLKVTPNHPMHINGKWMEIGNAKVGDKMKTLNGEEIIKTIEKINEESEVFNLEVEGNHNYIAEGYLAHNKKVGTGPGIIQ